MNASFGGEGVYGYHIGSFSESNNEEHLGANLTSTESQHTLWESSSTQRYQEEDEARLESIMLPFMENHDNSKKRLKDQFVKFARLVGGEDQGTPTLLPIEQNKLFEN
ncbi:hypothetical protein ACH5RR_025601 [Cinchona calisaya]|uniref:Uncharacterized protein n=1 Tax=Cinchona calisaya TaxID=153742 RepID=A0ABD2Z183_9GENT